MAELPNKHRRHPGPRGLRGRSRTRSVDGGLSAAAGGRSGGSDAPNEVRNAEGVRNGVQPNRRGKQDRPRVI